MNECRRLVHACERDMADSRSVARQRKMSFPTIHLVSTLMAMAPAFGQMKSAGLAMATEKLAGVANCFVFATSASGADPRLPAQLEAYFPMAEVRLSVIHFNNGMHGWGYNEADYVSGLPEVVEDLRKDAPSAQLIWASTTPVQNNAENGATNTRIEAQNAAAAKLMRVRDIPIDDQYSLMTVHANLHKGKVHYTAAGSEIQAEQVVKLVASMMQGP